MPIISRLYELFLEASFVAGQYELFLSSTSTSYLWKCHLLLCNMGNLRYCHVLLGNYLFLVMPYVTVQDELLQARLFVAVWCGLFLGVSVVTVQYYELFVVVVSCITVQYILFVVELQGRSCFLGVSSLVAVSCDVICSGNVSHMGG